MGKVIDSAGLQQFLNDGTVTHVPNHKAADKPNGALEVAKPAEVVNLGEKVDKAPAEVDKAPENEQEEAAAEQRHPQLSWETKKYVDKQFRLRKEAQEEAELDRRLAQEQYNRAVLAEDRARALESELSQAKKPTETPKVEELKFPMVADFVKDGQFDQDAYQKAVSDHNRAEAKKILDEERQTREMAQAVARVESSWDEARKAHSDFDDVKSKAEGTPADMHPQFVLNYIVKESENPGELSYFLWTHPQESQRIANLPPIRAIAALGKLEERLTKAPEPKVAVPEVKAPVERPGAPPPITPLQTSGSGTVNMDPSKMSFKELRALEREKLRKK